MEKQIFPSVAQDKKLYRFKSDSYWCEINHAKDMLQACKLYLKNHNISHYIGNNVKMSATAVLGPNVCIEDNCTIGEFTKLSNCIVFENTVIGNSCYIKDSIVGPKCKLDDWVRLFDLVVLGVDVTVAEGVMSRYAMVFAIHNNTGP